MPFTAEQIQDAGKSGLDFYLANNPVDQVGVERPLLKALQSKKKAAPGAKQFVVEQLRVRYASNFQWFNGSQTVTYNRRVVNEQANFAWRSCHDGLALDEDRLAQNGIIVIDSTSSARSASDAEKIQLSNLLEEQGEVLKLGFQEQFSHALHLDGTQSADAFSGLDALVSLTPTSGVVGGIDRAVAANAYWRNQVATGLTTTTTTGTILNQMEVTYRLASRAGGGNPDLMIAGSQFFDGYRNFMLSTFGRMDYGPGSFGKKVEGGTDALYFKGSEIMWSPEFADLDARYAPATAWEKRCYMLNTRRMTLRPLQGHDMVSRKPPRAYDRYEYYWAVTWRGALTMNQGNAQAVLAVA
jgi:hypothetical protein